MPDNVRIAVLIDGSYLNYVSNFYKFGHGRKRRLAVAGVLNYIRNATAHFEDVDFERSRIVETHYFRGRYTVGDLDNNARTPDYVESTLRNDRIFDQILAASNVTTHYTRIDTGQDPPKEQGIDVWLALEAFDLAISNRCDVVAILAGDGDFVPLIRKINAIGKRSLVAAWGIDGTDLRFATNLASEAAYFLDMANLIDKPVDKIASQLVDALFVEA